MARVPTATQLGLGRVQTRGVGSTPLQSLNTSADMFGAGMGRTATEAAQALDVVSEAAMKEIQEADERNLMEVEQAVRDWKYQQLQGENGVYSKRGGNAIGAAKAVTEGYQKFSSEALKGRELTPRALQKAQAYLAKEQTSIANEVSRYEQKEKLDYTNGLYEARISGAKEDAALYNNDPQKIAEAESKVRSTLRRSAEMNGWSPEEAQQQSEKEISALHKGVINSLLANNQGAMARAHFERNRDKIDGADIADVEKAVKAGVLTETAQGATDQIMALGLSETDALAKARSDFKGEERDEVVKRLKVRYAEASSLQTAAEKDLRASAWSKIASGQTPDNLTPAELAAAGRQVDSMWNMVANRAQRGKGFALTSETGVAEEYIAMDDSEIVDKDLTAIQSKLTEADYNKVLKRQKDAEKAIKELRENPGQDDEINELLYQYAPKDWGVSSAGNYTNKTSVSERAKINLFKDTMRKYVERAIADSKKVPPPSELRAAAARILLGGTIQAEGFASLFGGLADKDAAFMEVMGRDERGRFVIKDPRDYDEGERARRMQILVDATGVPEADMVEIIDALSETDKPLTISNIEFMRQKYEEALNAQ